ncbi:MAG: type II toxin-antitoxin system HicB family antitoxin [bacterium]|nr:type II toxin-antitoxin system HicB family antitoxin [bacterium]
MKLTATYQKTKKWYIGWVEEIPGANTQGKTLAECKRNLKEAVRLVIAANKDRAEKEVFSKGLIRESITI